MSNKKEEETKKKLLDYLEKEKIKTDQAGEILKAVNDEKKRKAEEAAFEEWKRGVRFRNTLAFLLLTALFLAVTYQGAL